MTGFHISSSFRRCHSGTEYFFYLIFYAGDETGSSFILFSFLTWGNGQPIFGNRPLSTMPRRLRPGSDLFSLEHGPLVTTDLSIVLCKRLPPLTCLARFLLNFFLYLRDIPRFRVPLTKA